MPSKKFPDPPSAGQARLARGWLAVLGCLVFPYLFLPARGAEPVVVRPAQGPAYRADRILVVPKGGRDLALRRLHTQNRSRVVHHFRDLGGVQVIEIPAGSSALDYVDRYQKSGEVEAAHVDHWFEPAALPNDPLLNSGVQWHLNNTGLSGGVPGADIHASMGWDILHEATNIIVAVIDSGLRLTHEDLAGNLWTNPAEIPDNEMDDDGNGIVDDIHGINAVSGTGRPEDDAGHGTHVAGILGAVGNNGLGVCGVAWKLQLMPCKFLSANGGSESGLLQCLEYARSKGAKIINCSFVAPPSSISPTLSNAFWTVRNAGIIVVAAAGNRGVNLDTDPEYPASFGMDNIIVVTATTRTDSFGGYSYGPNTVHLGAPGVDIYSTYFGFDSHYTTLSGTSMAAPCVAGALALVRARFPSLNYRQAIERVLATVDPLPSLVGRCRTGGRLNLARALGTGELEMRSGEFAWVPTNGLSSLNLTADGISPPLALPFTFHFYGEPYESVYVGANGILGFNPTELGLSLNADLPQTGSPNAIICPYWDNLDPSADGQIWTGLLGQAPHRRFVATWVDVPHENDMGGNTRYSFQAVLHETGEIAFQYLQVQAGKNSLVSGKSATVGVEDQTGLMGVRYGYNGSPATLTNEQAILLVPREVDVTPPVMNIALSRTPLAYTLSLSGQPGQRLVLSRSLDMLSWEAFATNRLPASGYWVLPDSPLGADSQEEQQFYRAELAP